MEDFIAIKKPEKLVQASLSVEAVTSEKRTLLRQEVFAESARKRNLMAMGFDDLTALANIDAHGGRPGHSSFAKLPHVGAYLIRATDHKLDQASEVLGEDYSLIPDIPLTIPNTTGMGAVGSKSRPQNWPIETGIELAHQEGVKGMDVLIGVLDTGCDAEHVQFDELKIDFRYFPPLTPYVSRSVRGFDPHGHGTHVCGIIAGKTTGVAPESSLMVASVIESETALTSLTRIMAALEWITAKAIEPGNESKAVILNLSLGFRQKDISGKHESAILAGIRDLMSTLIDVYDILPVVAIGNDGPNTMRYPGAFPEVLAVGAVDINHEPCDFSGCGSVVLDGTTHLRPDLCGYGSEVYSAIERSIEGGSRYAKKSGTSMAAPFVTGIAALLAQRYGIRGRELRNKLTSCAVPINAPRDRVGCGVARYVAR